MGEDADEKSKEFFNKIKDSKRYKRFATKEELLNYVKISLRECLISNSKRTIFDSTTIDESTYDDVDEEAIRLFKKFLKDKTIKDLFDERSNEQILECIGAGKIDAKGIFHLNNAGALFLQKTYLNLGLIMKLKWLGSMVLTDESLSTS